MRLASLLLVVLLVPALRAEGIWARLPAGGTYHGQLDVLDHDTLVIQGVPGELAVIRLKPLGAKPSYEGPPVDAWILTLLQANQPPRSWYGGPHEVLRTDPVQFGLDGCVVVRVRMYAGSGAIGHYAVRVSSKLPTGYAHPEVNESIALAADGYASTKSLETWLRPGLELRAKLHFGPNGANEAGPPLEPPEIMVTPPADVSAPWTESPAVPQWPYPHVWLDSFEPPTVAHVQYSVEDPRFHKLAARLRRRHVVVPPADEPEAPDIVDQYLFPAVVPVSGQLFLRGDVVPLDCIDSILVKTAHVWLASPGALDVQGEGVDITGPVELTIQQWSELQPSFILGFELPATVVPGLYQLQITVGTEGVVDACGDSPLKSPVPLPLLVFKP